MLQGEYCRKQGIISVEKREISKNCIFCCSSVSHCRRTSADRSQSVTQYIFKSLQCIWFCTWGKSIYTGIRVWGSTPGLTLGTLGTLGHLEHLEVLWSWENYITYENLNVTIYKVDGDLIRIKWTNVAHCLALSNWFASSSSNITSTSTTTMLNQW